MPAAQHRLLLRLGQVQILLGAGEGVAQLGDESDLVLGRVVGQRRTLMTLIE